MNAFPPIPPHSLWQRASTPLARSPRQRRHPIASVMPPEACLARRIFTAPAEPQRDVGASAPTRPQRASSFWRAAVALLAAWFADTRSRP